MTDNPTACHPITVVVGDQLCLEVECDHEHSAEGGATPIEDSYCDEVREETVCGTHSRFDSKAWGEELVHAEPWPCKHTARPAV